MKHAIRSVAAAAMLLAPLGVALVAQPAAAQQYRVAQQGRIDNMSINSSAGVSPGATLRVQVYATPGADWMNVALGDSGVRVHMREQAPGEYVGTHVVSRGDRIDPRDRMIVKAGWGQGPVTVAYNYPPSFQALSMGNAPAYAPSYGPLAITTFTMASRDGLRPGATLRFHVEGTPGARAFVNIPGVERRIPLREQNRPGTYFGSYTIRNGDDLRAFNDTRAVLRMGEERVSAQISGVPAYNQGYGYYGR